MHIIKSIEKKFATMKLNVKYFQTFKTHCVDFYQCNRIHFQGVVFVLYEYKYSNPTKHQVIGKPTWILVNRLFFWIIIQEYVAVPFFYRVRLWSQISLKNKNEVIVKNCYWKWVYVIHVRIVAKCISLSLLYL